MEYVGIQTQKSRNDFRSMLLLFMFPCLVTGMVYLFCLALAWLGLMDGTMAEEAAAEGSLWYHANSAFLQSVPYAFGGVLIDNQGVHGGKVTGEKGRQTCLQPGREPLHEPGHEDAEDKHNIRQLSQRVCERNQ